MSQNNLTKIIIFRIVLSMIATLLAIMFVMYSIGAIDKNDAVKVIGLDNDKSKELAFVETICCYEDKLRQVGNRAIYMIRKIFCYNDDAGTYICIFPSLADDHSPKEFSPDHDSPKFTACVADYKEKYMEQFCINNSNICITYEGTCSDKKNIKNQSDKVDVIDVSL